MKKQKNSNDIKRRRKFGEHLTPVEVFINYIFPLIKDSLENNIWVDLFAGEGNLILPILNYIPIDCRIDFFRERIFLFDVQQKMVEKCILNAGKYGIPKDIAKGNIFLRDTIKDYPTFLLAKGKPVFHVTNPPYLYLGYISKNSETQQLLDYFKYENSGYQDLYQVCLMNDSRHKIKKMIYVIPTNFLFGFSSANKIRDDFLKFYNIKVATIFEKEIFDFTGTNVGIFFFERKEQPNTAPIVFEAQKINKTTLRKTYTLKPENHYRAGNGFDDFVANYKALKALKISYYLTTEEVIKNNGEFEIQVIDVNEFKNGKYTKKNILVNKSLRDKILNNILFVRTVDTGSTDGRAGIYVIRDIFDVDGILVSKSRYRTHPIQIFFNQILSKDDQILLKDYVNLILEYFRKIEDSEFLTTYKYSNSPYTRKYLGLSQVKKIVETFPLLSLEGIAKEEFKRLIETKDIEKLFLYLKNMNARRQSLWE